MFTRLWKKYSIKHLGRHFRLTMSSSKGHFKYSNKFERTSQSEQKELQSEIHFSFCRKRKLLFAITGEIPETSE